MRRHLLPSTGPRSRISRSTFWRFFSDLAYICSCQGVPLSCGVGGAATGLPASGLVVVISILLKSGGGGLEVVRHGPAKGRELARGLIQLGAGFFGAPAQLAGECGGTRGQRGS